MATRGEEVEDVGIEVRRIVERGLQPDGFRPLDLDTSRGSLELRFYAAPGAECGVIWLGGVGGGWDTPALGLYPELARELRDGRLASVRVRFRHPGQIYECALDALVATAYLMMNGCKRVGVVGHSFGGAVALQTAALSPHVRAVVTLATQSHGAAPIRQLGNRCPTLLIHGTDDDVLPASSSQLVASLATGTHRLALLRGTGHGLDEAAEEVRQMVAEWLLANLRAEPPKEALV